MLHHKLRIKIRLWSRLWFRHTRHSMCLFTLHKYHTITRLHNVTQICLHNSHTIIVTFKHYDVLVCVVLDAVGQPQDRPELYHVFLLAFMREIRLPLRTASAFELAPQSRNAISRGVGLPSFFSAPAILPILCKKAARLPLLPDFSGDLAIETTLFSF